MKQAAKKRQQGGCAPNRAAEKRLSEHKEGPDAAGGVEATECCLRRLEVVKVGLGYEPPDHIVRMELVVRFAAEEWEPRGIVYIHHVVVLQVPRAPIEQWHLAMCCIDRLRRVGARRRRKSISMLQKYSVCNIRQQMDERWWHVGRATM